MKKKTLSLQLPPLRINAVGMKMNHPVATRMPIMPLRIEWSRLKRRATSKTMKRVVLTP